MAVETGQLYSAPFHIIPINQSTRDFYVYFLTHGGPERAAELFGNMRNPLKAHAISLEELDKAVNRFPQSLSDLDSLTGQAWKWWLTDNLHVLGAQFLHYTGEVRGRTLLLQTEMSSIVRNLAEDRSLPNSPVFANSLVFTLETGRATLSGLYDFRKLIPNRKNTLGYQDYQDHIGRVAVSLDDSDTRALTKDAVRTVFNVSEVRLPHPRDIHLTLVTAYKSPYPQQFPERLTAVGGLEVYFNNRLAMGIDMTPLSYLVLQHQLGQLPQVPPECLFEPVN